MLCAIRCEEYILHCFGIHKSLEELRNLAVSKGWLMEDGARIQDLGNTAREFDLKVEIVGWRYSGPLCCGVPSAGMLFLTESI